jgi:hypothetical protein
MNDGRLAPGIGFWSRVMKTASLPTTGTAVTINSRPILATTALLDLLSGTLVNPCAIEILSANQLIDGPTARIPRAYRLHSLLTTVFTTTPRTLIGGAADRTAITGRRHDADLDPDHIRGTTIVLQEQGDSNPDQGLVRGVGRLPTLLDLHLGQDDEACLLIHHQAPLTDVQSTDNKIKEDGRSVEPKKFCFVADPYRK